jgi:hypothetical protein
MPSKDLLSSSPTTKDPTIKKAFRRKKNIQQSGGSGVHMSSGSQTKRGRNALKGLVVFIAMWKRPKRN